MKIAKAMKKLLACMLVVVMAVAAVPMSGFVGLELPEWSQMLATKASAVERYTEGYYTYSVENDEATITGCDTSVSGKLVIPDTLGGYPVTGIGSFVFYNRTGLTSVTISDGVTSIGDYAFFGCSSLTSVTIGNGVKSIGDYAFYDCYGLTSVTIGNSVTSIGDSAFKFCDGLTSVTIGNGVTSIGDYAFYACDGLISVTIGNSVTSIGYHAFSYCPNLKNVYYADTEEKWNDISISSGNDKLLSANILFNHTHSYTSSIAQKATCTAPGAMAYTCSCGDSYTTPIPEIDHSYKTTTTKATASQDGEVVTACEVCGMVSSTKTIYKVSEINLSSTTLTYNGKAQNPTVTVKNSKGTTLKNGTDYTVTYSNNVNVGTATAKITGEGDYTGSVTKTFTIVPKSTTVISAASSENGTVTLKWKKQVTQTTGYEIQYSTSSKFTSPKTVSVTSNSTTSKTIKNLKATQKYYFRIRTYKTVSKKNYYSSWSKAVSAIMNGVVFNKTKTTVYIGDPLTLKASVYPKKTKVTWKSSDTKIAKVSSSGKVTGVKAGTATITASIKLGSKTYKTTCKITVLTPSIKLSKSKATVYTKESLTLKATVKPSGTKVTWKSSDTKIAKVSSSGKVTGVKAGTATITASIKLGSKTYKATCKITVKKNPYNTGKTPAVNAYINYHQTTDSLIKCVPITLTNKGNEPLVFDGVQGYSMSKEFTCLGFLWPEHHVYRGDELYGPGKIKEMSGNTITVKPGKTVTFYMALKESMYVLRDSSVLLTTNYKGAEYTLCIFPDGRTIII